MRKPYLTLFLLIHYFALTAQSIYYESFSGATFPSGWIPSDGRVVISNQVPSNGYSSSPTSPPASGGNNIRFDHCVPTGTTVSLNVTGV
ncbi:MAG: hypothetical protein L6Q97_25325, partial [Thermoanaerobaculia bacterium]|nr:hypothetical protein [Thermoanaerobaculia bacterium]